MDTISISTRTKVKRLRASGFCRRDIARLCGLTARQLAVVLPNPRLPRTPRDRARERELEQIESLLRNVPAGRTTEEHRRIVFANFC